MPLCSALGCRNNGVHRVPADENLKIQWIKALNRENWQPNSASRLCSEHFKPEDFYSESKYTGIIHQRRNLKKGTVPLFFNNSEKVPSKVTKNPQKIKANALAEIPGSSKISTNTLEAPKASTKIPTTITHIPEAPTPSITTPEIPIITTKTLETQKMTKKSLETPKVSKKALYSSKILTNTLIIPKLVSKKTSEVQRVDFLALSQAEVPSNKYFDAVCFCCLSTNIPVINAMKCEHNNFLRTYFQMNTETLYVCVNCHHILKKIETFRIQVNESCNVLKKCDFLKSQQSEQHKLKVNNLRTTPVLVFTYDTIPVHTNVKTECQNVETVFVTEFQDDTKQLDIKMEPESEIENEIYSETQPHISHTQNYIETHLSPISVTQNYTEKQDKHIKPTPLIQNYIGTHIKPISPTQNNTETHIPLTQNHTETHIKPTPLTQTNTEKHIKPISLTQNYSETHTKLIPLTQNYTETHIKAILLRTQNNTETHIPPTQSYTETHIPLTQNYTETHIPLTQNNTETHIPLTQNNTETQEKHTQLTVSPILKTKPPNKIYTGKIRILTLTEQELLQERHRLENDESYLKLQYKCESCIKGFDHKMTLKKHKEKHHPEFSDPLLTCKICKCVHSDRRQNNAHIKAHYRRFECVVCNKRSGDLPTLGYHYNTVHSNTDRQLYSPIPLQYSCQQCSYTTDSHRRYRYHKQKHKARTVCDICNKEFVGQSAYRRHIINSHRPTKNTYKCDQCPRTYKLKNTLATHRRTAHSGIKVQWHCYACDTRYGCEATYKAHLKTSANHVDLKFICNDCNRVFKRKITLRQHIEWEHLKNYIHKCLHCNKLYQTIGGLTAHVQSVHLKIKLPKDKICDYCGKGFSKNQQLTNHIRTHTGERPLHCDHCEATFAHDGALYKHRQLIHKVVTQRHLASS